MSKLFIFGIGGTGSRVLRALNFLLASGTHINASAIVPIIIDPDRENGDVNRTVEMLTKYQQIRQKLEFNHNGFFKTDIQTLSSIEAAANGFAPDQTAFKYNIDGRSSGQFDRFLDYNLLGPENKALMNALFTPSNLGADLTVGFKGNPNMGSIVLNQFSTSADFQKFASCVSQGDRIFIISSIFGGTGAAGFPLLVKNIREAHKNVMNQERLKNTPIGAVTVMPYFSVMPGSAIDSNTFVAKSKAALNYYRHQLLDNQQLNALYYLADSNASAVAPQEGGVNQANNAHYIELLAALAIIDFAGEGNLTCSNGKAQNPIFKEYGLVKGDFSNGYHFKHLGRTSRMRISKALIQYAYMVNYLHKHLNDAIRNKQSYTVGNIDNALLSSTFFSQDLKVFNEHFIKWLEEMALNTRKFKPLIWDVRDNELHNMVNGITQTAFKRIGALWGKTPTWGYVEFNHTLNNVEKVNANLTPEQRLFMYFYKATETLYKLRIEPQMGVSV